MNSISWCSTCHQYLRWRWWQSGYRHWKSKQWHDRTSKQNRTKSNKTRTQCYDVSHTAISPFQFTHFDAQLNTETVQVAKINQPFFNKNSWVPDASWLKKHKMTRLWLLGNGSLKWSLQITTEDDTSGRIRQAGMDLYEEQPHGVIQMRRRSYVTNMKLADRRFEFR